MPNFDLFTDDNGNLSTARDSTGSGGYIAGVPGANIYTAILGGQNNTNSGYYSSVLMGNTNTINHGCYNTIAGGCMNTISGYNAFIGSGWNNTICNACCASVIGGGIGHTVSNSYSGTFSGYNNCVSGRISAIAGGESNTASGNYSFIGGGFGNSDNGLNYAGVFGCNVTANTSCAFHSNNFVAQDIPPGIPGTSNPPAIAQPGSLYYVLDGSGNKQVYVA